MRERKRRQSKNSQLFHQILVQMREYDVEEVRLLCEKHKRRNGHPAMAEKAGRD